MITGGESLVSHAGGLLLVSTAGAAELCRELSRRPGLWRRPWAPYDPGKIVLDLAAAVRSLPRAFLPSAIGRPISDPAEGWGHILDHRGVVVRCRPRPRRRAIRFRDDPCRLCRRTRKTAHGPGWFCSSLGCDGAA